MPSRIIPVSSGKGGVGKTTVAINLALALSRYAPTLLVDLDTGTSSVRNSLDLPVTRDLYHFFRKGAPLTDCVTRLPRSWDPAGRFKDFGFVAGPLHLIDEITNFGPERKKELSNAINRLPARWVILDLKAGVDPGVIDFLPYSNSGILVFTPHLPAATMAASDIVKAILFRKLRIVFSAGSPFYGRVAEPEKTRTLVNGLLDQVEDVYESALPNLDHFLADLKGALGEHPVLDAIVQAVEYFRVFYVLNGFNGVTEAFDTAVKPFVSNLVETVSERLVVTNLGWVVKSDEVHQANCSRRPVLLTERKHQLKRPTDAEIELDRLMRQTMGLSLGTRERRPVTPVFRRPDPETALARQLDVLRRMYGQGGDGQDDPRENFDYIASRAVHVLEHGRPSEFGMPRIAGREEVLSAFFPPSGGTPAALA